MFRKRGTYSARVFVPKLASDQTGWLERRRLHFLRTDIPQPKQFPGVDVEDPFNQRIKETYADWDDSPQVYAEYDDYLVRLEAPTSSDSE